jgi:hypothetical protein
MITYTNEYGTLELEPSEYVDIDTIRVATTPDEFKFDLPTAEKIALLTETARTQIAFDYPKMKQAIIVHHVAPSIVAVCRVHSLNFKPGVDAREEIQRHSAQSNLAALRCL